MERITEKKENGFYELKRDQEIYGEENGIRLVQIVGQYEDIGEKFGISPLTLIEALTSGIWINGAVSDSKNKIIFVRPTLYIMGKKLVVGFVIPYAKRTDKEGHYFGTVRYFDGYGKTWALDKETLTKEELE